MNEIVYVKYSNERDNRFCVITELLEDKFGNKVIKKIPMYREAVGHVLNMNDVYSNLVNRYRNLDISINKCIRGDTTVEFEYLEGETLQEKVNTYIKNDSWDKVYEIIDNVVEIIRYCAVNDFIYTDEFKQVFGNEEGLEECKCSDVTDVDMILSNIIVNDEISIIDYEWTFLFPIPYKFVVFRLCFFLIHQCNVNGKISMETLMDRYDIHLDEYHIFVEMEKNFQKYIHKNRRTLREIGTEEDNKIRNINDINEVYINNPNGLFVDVYEMKDNEQQVELERRNIVLNNKYKNSIKTDSNRIKIEINCGCGLILFNEMNFEIESSNGMKIAEGIYLYIADSMQFIINTKESAECNLDFVVVKMEIKSANNLKNAIDSFVEGNMRLNEEVFRLKSKYME